MSREDVEMIWFGVYLFILSTSWGLWIFVFRPWWLAKFWNGLKDCFGILDVLAPGETVISSRQQEQIQEMLEYELIRKRGYISTGLEPWTPFERLALGIDDNDRFIRETQQILNEHEWSLLTRQDHDEVAPPARLR